MLFGEAIVDGAGEGAGAVRFARNMGGDGEALANALAPRELEHPAVLVGQRNHLVKPRPGEADAGDIACAVDGIGPAERLLVEPLRPAVRIIVDADRGAASSHVDMV